jgi:hypothetical protein
MPSKSKIGPPNFAKIGQTLPKLANFAKIGQLCQNWPIFAKIGQTLPKLAKRICAQYINNGSRVTRLGELLPLGQLISLIAF